MAAVPSNTEWKKEEKAPGPGSPEPEPKLGIGTETRIRKRNPGPERSPELHPKKLPRNNHDHDQVNDATGEPKKNKHLLPTSCSLPKCFEDFGAKGFV